MDGAIVHSKNSFFHDSSIEANASELLRNLKEIVLRYYVDSSFIKIYFHSQTVVTRRERVS